MAKTYDLVVIGTGTAASVAAAQCHSAGWRVAVHLRGFAADSPLEGDGFEPSVPGTKEPVFVVEGELRGPNGGSQKGLFLVRYRWFESISLRRRVRCEPVSRGNWPSYVEKLRFSAGVRAGRAARSAETRRARQDRAYGRQYLC